MERNPEQDFRCQKLVNKSPSLIINSLRTQINRVPTFNKFHSFKQNNNQYNSQNKFQINNIADKIRSTFSGNNDINDGNNNDIFNNCDFFSPFRKKSKNLENSFFRDQISLYHQMKAEKESLDLYNINKMRQERIKLNNNLSNDKIEKEKIFPIIYTPLSSIKFLNLQELSLLISLFYSYTVCEPNKYTSFSDNIELVFLSIDQFNSNQLSVIITGKLSHSLDEKYLFSNKNSHLCKFFLNFIK